MHVTWTSNHSPCFILVSWMVITGWRRLIGSPKLQIIFHKRATKYRSLLRKMTYKDKGSYESSPPCKICVLCSQVYRHRFICVFYICDLDKQPLAVIHICFFDGHSDMYICSHCYSQRFIRVFDICDLDKQPLTVIHTSVVDVHSDMYIYTYCYSHIYSCLWHMWLRQATSHRDSY